MRLIIKGQNEELYPCISLLLQWGIEFDYRLGSLTTMPLKQRRHIEWINSFSNHHRVVVTEAK